jgi:predicted RNase H-like HicB family nuclease
MIPEVRDYLASSAPEYWFLCDDSGAIIGFIGMSGSKMESLFLGPEFANPWKRGDFSSVNPAYPGIGGETMQLTAVSIAVPEGYVAFVEELPGANTQGDTFEQVRENLRDAVELVLEANRELAEQSLTGRSVTREAFDLGRL